MNPLLTINSNGTTLVAIGCIVLLLGLATCSSNDGLEEQPEQQGSLEPALFDFSNYQQLFAKHYKSQLETVTRRVYFLANAFKVYVASVAYRFWKRSSYLAVNEFADRSKQELDKMVNRVISGDDLMKSPGERLRPAEAPKLELERNATTDKELEEIAQALELEIKEKLKDSSLANLIGGSESHRRRKRGAQDELLERRPPRALTLDQLISGKRADENNGERVKAARNPKGNNPDYDALAMEPVTQGLRDQQEELEIWYMNPTEAQRKQSALVRARNMLGADKWRNNPFANLDGLTSDLVSGVAPGGLAHLEPDVVFSDLRNTRCMLEPRHQGTCGCCYAFAAVSMMEYLYCRKTGQLVQFSEQYLVDCGNKRVKGMEGCDGAGGWSVPTFIHNFGLELAQHYPYLERESQCPYSDNMDLKKAGFIRMDLSSVTRIPVASWEEQLKVAPMYAAVAAGDDFHLYGGGVDDGRACAKQANHAMVVIGHGREDGQEYWLLRNSHGLQWGQRGHYKLSKSAPERCIQFQEGLAFGLGPNNEYVSPKINHLNPTVITMANAAQNKQRAQKQQQQQAGQSFRTRMMRHQQQQLKQSEQRGD